MRRILRGILWAMVWVWAGPIIGITFGRALDQPFWPSLILGAAPAAGLGFIYGLCLPDRKKERPHEMRRARFVPEACAWCRGNGVKGKAGRPCRICDGQGRVLVEQPSRRCPRCRGRGQVLLGRNCPICAGAGWTTYVLLGKAIQPEQPGKPKRIKTA